MLSDEDRIMIKKVFSSIKSKIKETVRKFLVFLKRNPQSVPLVALAVAFVYYSFNLTYISDTTALINLPHMGLSSFATMLFSILSFVCMLNAFPKRQRPNFFMLALLGVMAVIIVFCDVYYFSMIQKSTIEITSQRYFVPIAKEVVSNHIILMTVMVALTALEPLIAKLFRKINTSIDVEYTEDIGDIDLSDEE